MIACRKKKRQTLEATAPTEQEPVTQHTDTEVESEEDTQLRRRYVSAFCYQWRRQKCELGASLFLFPFFFSTLFSYALYFSILPLPIFF